MTRGGASAPLRLVVHPCLLACASLALDIPVSAALQTPLCGTPRCVIPASRISASCGTMFRCRRIAFLRIPRSFLWAVNAFAWSFAVCGDSRDDRDGIFRRSSPPWTIPAWSSCSTRETWSTRSRPASGTCTRGDGAVSKPLRVVIGNHELYGGGTPGKFAERFGLPGPHGPSPTRTPTSRS